MGIKVGMSGKEALDLLQDSPHLQATDVVVEHQFSIIGLISEARMNELGSLGNAQLMAIEQIYGIQIKNREEVARLIGEKAGGKRQVLTICTLLNSWVAVNLKEVVIIPSEVLEPLFLLTDWQSRNA
jgi:hypothetical protein